MQRIAEKLRLPENCPDPGIKMHFAEILHRAELTVQERADHVAEWVRLTEGRNKPAQDEPVSTVGGRGNTGGINAAVRELGIDRNAAQRAVRIAGITPDARAA